MPEPITLILLAKLALGVGGKLAVKAFFLAKMAGLKAFLVKAVGAHAASISVGVLASAATVIYWEKHIKGNSDHDAIMKGVAEGVTYDVGQQIIRWFSS